MIGSRTKSAFLGVATIGLTTLAYHTVLSYSAGNASWPTSDVLYYINAANQDVGSSAARTALQQGAQAWSAQSNASVRLVYAGGTTAASVSLDGQNNVFFRNQSNSNIASAYRWWNGANELIDFDIVFWDGSTTFFTGSSGCSSGGAYVEDIAAHEFGHGLGLDHSNVTGATMYPTYKSCTTGMRSLSSDDVAGIESLYPPSGRAQPPAAPTNLTAQPDDAYPHAIIDLRWVDHADDETQFLVERANDGQTFQVIGQTATNQTAYSDTTVTSQTTYWYRVRAGNGAGTSSPSNVVSTQTAPAPAGEPSGTVDPPTAPSNPSPSVGATVSRDVDLAWSPGARATSYDVYLGQSSSPGLYQSGVTSTALVLPRLGRNKTYYWRVVARNSGGTASSQTWWFATGTSGGGRGQGRGSKK